MDVTGNTSSGVKTLFYTRIGSIPEHLKKDPNIRVIDTTEAGRFIESSEFKCKLYEIFGDADSKEAKNFLFGIDSTGDGGAFNLVSKRFATATKGELFTLIGENANSTRIFFYKTEWEEIQKNADITRINGVDAKKFIEEMKLHDQIADQLQAFNRSIRENPDIYKELKISPDDLENMVGAPLSGAGTATGTSTGN